MCEHCIDGKIPVRVLTEDGTEGEVVGETLGASIVNNLGTVYITVDGRNLAVTVPDWYSA